MEHYWLNDMEWNNHIDQCDENEAQTPNNKVVQIKLYLVPNNIKKIEITKLMVMTLKP